MFFILLTIGNFLFCLIIANDLPLTEWEYLPPVGPRPPRGFVGLKNAGATCYMNSVLQQLYMIEDIRNGILSVEGAATDPNEDFSGEERVDNEVKLNFYHERFALLHCKMNSAVLPLYHSFIIQFCFRPNNLILFWICYSPFKTD